jgi:uncharacterized membrane protein
MELILKVCVYRLLTIGTTVGVAYLLTRDLQVALCMGWAELLLKTLYQFIFEFVWKRSISPKFKK